MLNDAREDREVYVADDFRSNKNVLTAAQACKQYPQICAEILWFDTLSMQWDARSHFMDEDVVAKAQASARQARFEHGEKPIF